MLTRIVRMTFKETSVADFLEMFYNKKDKIGNFPGCKHLVLLKDADIPNTFMTYSIWENEAALERYRKSALFKETWATTKKWFAEKPIAFSAEEVHFD
ncbi:MAG: antibiotic biosynthesis monooxygenase family protein [Bacteroidota bacterium]